MKIATVGAWHVHTQEYAEAIQKNPKAQLCCLWDDNQERGQAMAEKLGVPFQPDLDAIWADPTIEGVQVTASWARSPTPGCTTTTMAACVPRPTAPWVGCRPTSTTQPKPAAAL